MNFFDLMFRTGPGIKKIFEYGIEPKEKEFFKLTEEQYNKLKKETNCDTNQKWYSWLPLKHSYESKYLLILTERQKEDMFSGAKIIEKYCEDSGKTFHIYEEKLEYVASKLPSFFSKGTKYECRTL